MLPRGGSAGPLAGLRVLELAKLGPAPHAAMVLADLGADVVRVERPAGRALQLGPAGATDIVLRGRRSVFADLEQPEGRALVLALAARTDVVVDGLGVDPARVPAQGDRSGWPALRARFTELFASRTRDAWAAHFVGTDACVTPVLTFAEAGAHPHLVARRTLVEADGVLQAAPASRFSRTPGGRPSAPGAPGADSEEVLGDWGVDL
ncbi:CoA transferase [Streptomyces sp. MMS24-I2-30]|uniref:CoA transferase n=1 Tax=Streptomyces sp. MMS24-I2-30 TaxID=3351564 RepID=UPI003896CD1A